MSPILLPPCDTWGSELWEAADDQTLFRGVAVLHGHAGGLGGTVLWRKRRGGFIFQCCLFPAGRACPSLVNGLQTGRPGSSTPQTRLVALVLQSL